MEKMNIRPSRIAGVAAAAVAAGVFMFVVLDLWVGHSVGAAQAEEPASPQAEASVDLDQGQLGAIAIAPVGTHLFPIEREAVGAIDYDEDLSVQVLPPYQGKIIAALANLGDDVRKGQPLYTIDSPDLIQAESTLIGAAATLRSHQQGAGARQGPRRTQRGIREGARAGDQRRSDCGRRAQGGARRGQDIRQDRGGNRSA